MHAVAFLVLLSFINSLRQNDERPFPVRWPSSRLTALSIGCMLFIFLPSLCLPRTTSTSSYSLPRVTGRPKKKVLCKLRFARGDQLWRWGAGPWHYGRTSEASGGQKSAKYCVLILLQAPSSAILACHCFVRIFPWPHKGTARKGHLTNCFLTGRRVESELCGTHTLTLVEGWVYLWSLVTSVLQISFTFFGIPMAWSSKTQSTVNVWCGRTWKYAVLLFLASTQALQLETVALWAGRTEASRSLKPLNWASSGT